MLKVIVIKNRYCKILLCIYPTVPTCLTFCKYQFMLRQIGKDCKYLQLQLKLGIKYWNIAVLYRLAPAS